jgi:hypothetical protein
MEDNITKYVTKLPNDKNLRCFFFFLEFSSRNKCQNVLKKKNLIISRFDEFMVPFEKTFATLLALNSVEAFRQEHIKVMPIFHYIYC